MSKIVIIGDVMLDINYLSEINRKAPEANIPIYNILETKYKLGGAANVANNINLLYNDVILISVIGDDFYGNMFKSILEEKNICHKLFIDNNRKTTQKHRIIYNNKIQTRYDIENKFDINDALQREIIDYIKSIRDVNSIIISDYDKGLITFELCRNIINYSNENTIYTFIDPKTRNYLKYNNCFLFKPNQIEAEIITSEIDIYKIVEKMNDLLNIKNILVTRSENGMILNNENNKNIEIKTNMKVDVRDVTGAGDIVISILVYCFYTYKNLILACNIANYIASKSVSVIGNYETNIADIENYFIENRGLNLQEKIIYDNENNKIFDISKKYKNIVFTNGCFDILHSAHIELLQFSKTQGDILVVGLNSDESIKRLKGKTRPINDVNERAKMLSLFNFVDYIIIFNDDTPFYVINFLKPNILVKGGDYNKNNIVGADIVEKIVIFNYMEGKSTSNIIEKIKKK